MVQSYLRCVSVILLVVVLVLANSVEGMTTGASGGWGKKRSVNSNSHVVLKTLVQNTKDFCNMCTKLIPKCPKPKPRVNHVLSKLDELEDEAFDQLFTQKNEPSPQKQKAM